jgi:hypothetical protein
MQRKLLFASVMLILLGTTIFGLSLYSEPQSTEILKEIGDQAGEPIVRFTLPPNSNGVVMLNATGSFSISNSTILTIVNQTGEIEYLQHVTNLPIQAHLFNSSGEYVATFEQLKTTNSTVLIVSTNVLVNQAIVPFNYLLPYGTLLTWVGIILFPISVHKDIKTKLKIEITNKKNRFISVNESSNIYLMLFVIYLFSLTFLLSIPSSIFLGQYWAIIILSFGVPIAGIVYYLKTISYVRRLDIQNSFQEIVSIQRTLGVINIFYYGTFIFLVACVILNLLSSFNFVSPVFIFLLGVAVLHAFFSIFTTMLTPEGTAVVYFLSFSSDFKKNNCSARFQPIKKASKALAELIKPYNLMFAPASISASISYNVVVEKDVTLARIWRIVDCIEQSPTNYKNLLALVKNILDQGVALESKGLKGLPSFFEKYNKHILAIVPIITAVIGLITVLSKLFGF